jgi:hypothetical protein
VRVAASPSGGPINQILDMEWVLVGNGYATSVKETEKLGAGQSAAGLTPSQAHEEAVHLALLKRIAETRSFYYAPDYDLSNCLQRNDAAASGVLVDGASSGLPSWLHSDDRFWWNKSAMSEVLAAAANERPAGAGASSSSGIHGLVVAVINGFVGTAPLTDFAADLLLLSRRACARQGTRFNMRGADAEGNVANYAETEQILRFGNGALSSFVQVRGSIPLAWEQPVTLKYTPRAVLSPSRAVNHSVFSKHISAMLERYGRATAVNLIDKKGDQKVLGTAYEEEARAASPPLKYVWWDFHGETKKSKGGWASLGKLLAEVRPDLEADGLYERDGSARVVCTQKGVFRTNCMDNLDRTNVVQSLFARAAALSAVPGATERMRVSGCSALTSPFPEFERAFNNLWADNADAMSFLYSGTGALKTDFTRTGKRTLGGLINDGINSVQRYVLNNLEDGRSQDAWDLFLGRYVPGPYGGAGKGSRGGGAYSSAMSAHLAGTTAVSVRCGGTVSALRPDLLPPSPPRMQVSLLSRAVAIFAGLSLAIAIVATSPQSSRMHRAFVGAGGATLILTGLVYGIVARGWPRGLGVSLVSRPTFIGPGAAPFAHPGRDAADGVVGGAHVREHGALAPGATVVPTGIVDARAKVA